MEMIKKHKVLLVIGLVIGLLLVAAAVIILFFRTYLSDVRALTGFETSYHNYDQAMADFSRPVLAAEPTAADLENKADETLFELKFTASVKISSLIKNDAELMSTALQIASLSDKELAALKTYKNAAAEKNANLTELAKQFADWSHQRQAAYAHFMDLAGGN